MTTLSNKKVFKSVKEYVCEVCDYNTSIKQHYDKHINTSKHKDATLSNKKVLKSVKSVKEYVCEVCDYNTSIKQHYDKHINTIKHLQKSDTEILKSVNVSNTYICENCNKVYNDRTGLWRHNKVCLQKQNEEEEFKLITYMFLELVRQNSEFKELLLEQNKQNQTLQNQFIELAKEKSNITNTNCHNNTTNNNNHFNLQLFLNKLPLVSLIKDTNNSF
jgi:hypothetical protein